MRQYIYDIFVFEVENNIDILEEVRIDILNNNHIYYYENGEYHRDEDKEAEIKVEAQKREQITRLQNQISEKQVTDHERDKVLDILINDYFGFGKYTKEDKTYVENIKQKMLEVKTLGEELNRLK